MEEFAVMRLTATIVIVNKDIPELFVKLVTL